MLPGRVVGNSISQYAMASNTPSEFVERAIDEHPIASGATLMLMMAAVGALGFVRISMAPQSEELGTGRFATSSKKKRAKQLANKQNKADGLRCPSN